ncbi:MAG: hypothetical protein WA705_10525 [Candidatus Ozemobacteraceae bacterium]
MNTRSKGISLLEIMLATCILAFSMIPVAGMIGFGFRETQRDDRQVKAIQLCQATLNQAMGTDYSQLTLGTAVTSISSGAAVLVRLGAMNVEGATYTVRLIVADKSLSFKMQTVDVNQPGYSPATPSTWVFSAAPNISIPSNGAYQITAEVSWTEHGVPQTVALSSFKANLQY